MTGVDSPALQVQDLCVTYRSWGERVTALQGVCLALPRGGWTLLTGANGSGKSTLLRVLGGLVQPCAGAVSLFGRDPWAMSPRKRAAVVSLVHQRPEDGLAPGMTIAEHAIACGLSRKEFEDRLVDLELDKAFPFVRAAWDRPVDRLSGGERQVFGLALQLIRRTPLLLLDEVFAALDQDRADHVFHALRRAARDCTVVQVTHQPENFAGVATRRIRMEHGRLAEGWERPVA